MLMFLVLTCLLVAVQCTSSKRDNHAPRPLKPRLLVEDVLGDIPSDIFAGDGGGDDDDDDSDNDTDVPGIPSCIFPDAYGDYGTENAYTEDALVSWTYQVQGKIEMSVNTVKTIVIPQLEALLSKLLITQLFDTPVCDAGEYTAGASYLQRGNGGERQLQRRRMLDLKFWDLSNGSRVTGLLVEPRDIILPNFAGVNCDDTEYIPGSPRCFKLIGGITLTGQLGDIDEAVNITQEAIRSIFNSEGGSSLNDVHGSLSNVQYLAPEPDYHIYFGGKGPEPDPDPAVEEPKNEEPTDKDVIDKDEDSSKDWPIWPWIVGGSCLITGVVAMFLIHQRSRGSFGQIRGSSGGTRGLLALERSSDESSNSTNSSEAYRPSNTWKNLRLGELDLADGPADGDSADDSRASTRIEEGRRKPTKYSSQPISTGSFPDASHPSGLQFVDQTGEKTEISTSSHNSLSANSGGLGTDSGSSSPGTSDGSSLPPARAWKRHMV
eukprot:CAMPEP_0198147560 /NCGR_PEP_ID=MMETSP1443-20131203/36611_1 /TAXON_ID=186043 /ORGANISM="Entomoneis sp., Strain CCMP2396" /LENGTH=490 /DNA_ID=CAMNT_0043811959 /DNA_START=105 /DNA_END=1577 /DNA_ORIENTATION=-